MASLISSIFTSHSSALKARIESMRTAELSLVSMAYQFDGSERTKLETIDTQISSLFLAPNANCLMYPSKDPDELIIHSVHAINSSTNTAKTPLVLLHGYSNSCLYFYRNLYGLANHFQNIHALDLLGWGLSSRPKFPSSDIKIAEDFFVESLEAWRKQHKMEKMILGGHSMGGYLSVAYCEKYPERVEKLILISPVGVPDPDSDQRSKREFSYSVKMMINTAKLFWNAGVTPASFLRSLTEYRGRQMVEGYVKKRLPGVKCEEEQAVLTDYLYNNAALPGSGEYCLNALLKPLGFARSPLIYRIPKLKVRQVHFIYGEKDWMNPTHGYEVKGVCDKSGPRIGVYQVKDAGHLLMIENWKGFNEAMVRADEGILEDLIIS